MKVVSLFSGAGGLDYGFLKAGHKIVWANDNFSDAVETYRRNIGDHIKLGSIEVVSSDEIPNHDILVGGFPCQGFSVANVKRHGKDERNSLYLEMLRVICDKKPKYFLAENVKGILSLEGGRVFEMILNDFMGAGVGRYWQIKIPTPRNVSPLESGYGGKGFFGSRCLEDLGAGFVRRFKFIQAVHFENGSAVK